MIFNTVYSTFFILLLALDSCTVITCTCNNINLSWQLVTILCFAELMTNQSNSNDLIHTVVYDWLIPH